MEKVKVTENIVERVVIGVYMQKAWKHSKERGWSERSSG
jgi:hypothetical protein